MSNTESPLTVAQALELKAGNEENATWINQGVTGVVRNLTPQKMKSGKTYWKVVLADQVGSATLEVSFFNAPRFGEGAIIEMVGSGIRRTEYNGKQQIAISPKTEVHKIGESVHHAEQKTAAESGAPALNGEAQHIAGQTVGMALKLAIDILAEAATGPLPYDKPTFWFEVHTVSSDIIRVAQLLEKGKMAPAIRDRTEAGEDVAY